MTLVRVGPESLSAAAERAALEGAGWAPADVAVIRMTGPAVADCLQGLLTNDVVAPGPDGFVYGALLTTKGMIVCDLWVARDGEQAWVFAPLQGLEAALEIFTRFVPPRLARHERAQDKAVIRLVGPKALARAAEAGIAVPNPGTGSRGEIDGVVYRAGRPSVPHGFELQMCCDRDGRNVVTAALESAGVEPLPAAALAVARVLAGVPRLHAETDDKTLPQEVRFEDLDGVSYSKGCYTGQETVARVHFRGHPNRWLAGLVWDEAPLDGETSVVSGGKTVGRVTSVVALQGGARWLGLAVIRREVEPGATVTAAGAAALVRALPHDGSA